MNEQVWCHRQVRKEESHVQLRVVNCLYKLETKEDPRHCPEGLQTTQEAYWKMLSPVVTRPMSYSDQRANNALQWSSNRSNTGFRNPVLWI